MTDEPRPDKHDEGLEAPASQGFDPNGSSAEELLLSGYPERPDAQLPTKFYEHWRQVVSPSISRIEPEFGVSPIVRPPIGPIEPPPTAPSRGTSSNWSGSVAYPWQFPVTTVAGRWTVPTVSDPGDGAGIPVCSTWIGIDGWTDENSFATDVLQAGTTQLVGSAFAWSEWVPANAKTISNLQVSAGDVIFCVIRAKSPTQAAVFLVNETTGKAVLFPKTAPGTTTLVGATAEWIVELPASLDGQPVELGDFGSVTFDHCVAYGDTGSILYPAQGELLTMVNPQNYEIAVPTVLADDSIRIDFTPGTPDE